MNEELDRLDPSRKLAALKKLADHLAALDTQGNSTLPMESDMLSLIASGTLNGEELSSRYPDFYRKLLEDVELRQAFLDALESVEAERTGQLVPMPNKIAASSLAFLNKQPAWPVVEVLDEQNWRATWRKTLEQLEAIFSPPELAYRADPSLSEDPWFTLLRDELSAVGTIFAVALDCTLSTDREDVLSAFLTLAITLGNSPESVQLPLRASLHWGDYQESVVIYAEGRIKFPDIPLAAIFDQAQTQLQSGFDFSLEPAS